jgi:hypothetical protein
MKLRNSVSILYSSLERQLPIPFLVREDLPPGRSCSLSFRINPHHVPEFLSTLLKCSYRTYTSRDLSPVKKNIDR